jgi:hypothetical protein
MKSQNAEHKKRKSVRANGGSIGALLAVSCCLTLVTLTPTAPAASSRRQQPQKPPANAAQPAPINDPKKLTFGDVEVLHFQKMTGNIDRGMKLTGSRTLVTVSDKASRSTLVFHADEITFRKEKKDVSDHIEMKGSLRYTVTQKEKDGSQRLLEGTAGAGAYRRIAERLELNGGVNATLTDEVRLKKPASVVADRVTVNIGTTPFTYSIGGSPQTTRVQFEPRPPAPEPNAKEAPRSGLSYVEITRFREGTFQAGLKAEFNGPDVTVKLRNDSDGTDAKFEGEEIETIFAEDRKSIKRVVTNRKATFTVKRPARENKGEEVVDGSCGRAIYDADEDQVTLKEAVEARVTSPLSLKEPATLTADMVMFRTKRPYQYVVSGAAERTRIKFTPKPPTVEPPGNSNNQPAPQYFAFGTVVIEAFDKGDFEPGKSAQFTGGAKMQFRSDDPDAKTQTRLLCRRVVATFADDETIGTAEATGGVTYHIQQPDAMTKKLKAIRGTADRATFGNTTQARELKLFGPINAEVIDDEHLIGPGKITGPTDTSLTLNLAKDITEFDIESPTETAVIRFSPREATPESDAKQPAKPAEKKSAEKKK